MIQRCGTQRTFETIMSVYENQALDPYVNREKLKKNSLNENIKLPTCPPSQVGNFWASK
ncbi:Mobile element protein [Methanosarcina siciliae C2J]|uniref:Mobile element protein n=1 Tax=Methanosarcina siciliae C2J TaxID=1434118 RepID=A0A0E3PRP2_9EURY|nr:Mobile element protein [Methanosarcina siciliae C2J]